MDARIYIQKGGTLNSLIASEIINHFRLMTSTKQVQPDKSELE
jgi:hypothetical protein